MDDLPELPFEKVLSYLSLQDRLRLSAVSRSCREKIANSRVKNLCYSERPIGCILGKSRWISGKFAENFISSTRFECFFNAFSKTILSNLKHLRLCDLDLSIRNETAFARTLNSFSQLEELDIIRAKCDQQQEFKLNLPMLTSIHLEELTVKLTVKWKLTLEASRLREVRLKECIPNHLDIVHGESVESLMTSYLEPVMVMNLRNLKKLYVDHLPEIPPTFLSGLKQLNAVHLGAITGVLEFFEQKRRYGRADLKIYLCGCLLNGPDDPAMEALRTFRFPSGSAFFRYMVENPSRLADVIPFYRDVFFSQIESVAPGLETVLNKFTDLKHISVRQPVRDIQRFLDLVKNFKNIVQFRFEDVSSQDLFDRLPEHCAVQDVMFWNPPSDLAFLFRLKHLIHLRVIWSVDSETIRKAFEELPVLSSFTFKGAASDPKYNFLCMVSIETDLLKQFRVSIDRKEKRIVSNLNAAIEFIENEDKPEPIRKRSKKRKTRGSKPPAV